MRKLVIAVAAVAVGSGLPSSSAVAGPTTDALSACLADNTTGRDRKELARWVFFGMASHPEMRSLSNVTQADRDGLDRAMASTVMRLVTENCRAEGRSALNKDGNAAFEAAFATIGKLAMQELMSNPDVNTSFSRYTRYIDQKKLSSALTSE